MGYDPSDEQNSGGILDPVQGISWYHALSFCNTLSLLEGLVPVYSINGRTNPMDWGSVPATSSESWNAAGANWSADGYRLPTEMEWLWAAMGADSAAPGQINRTGYDKAFSGSNGSNLADDYAWYDGNSGNKTHPA